MIAIPADEAMLLELEDWFRSDLGREVLVREQELIDQCLPCLFGYHLLQLSVSRDACLYRASPIRHKFALSPMRTKEGISARAAPESLPLEADSVDVALLHHVLEFSQNPHRLLRETSRILMPRGHLLITGFNPWSVFGLWGMLGRRFGSPLSRSHLLGSRRVADWLRLLGFGIESVRYTFYRLPVNRSAWLQRFARVERIGTRLAIPLGSVYQVHACKEVIPVTPVRPHWERRRAAIGVVGLAKPSARNT